MTIQQLQVLAGFAGGNLGDEAGRWPVALQVGVIQQVAGRNFAVVGVDVLRGLLAPDAKRMAEVIGGESPLPQCHDLDQAVAGEQIPSVWPGASVHAFSRVCCTAIVPDSTGRISPEWHV